MNRRPVGIVSLMMVGVGAILLALTIVTPGAINVALPLLFLMLGSAFAIAALAVGPRWVWARLFFLPAGLLLAFGVVFLINILTQDWNAWAYAWLLLVAGLGTGTVLANRQNHWPAWVSLVGWGALLAGITLFAVFGAIAGGLFIQVMAPILLILGGLSLRWLPLEQFLPDSVLKFLGRTPLAKAKPSSAAAVPLEPSEQPQLAEPLSTRELEVLQLVNQGLSNQQIALRLNVAPSTVKTHINNIYGKLDVQTRVQAVTRARDLGLIE